VVQLRPARFPGAHDLEAWRARGDGQRRRGRQHPAWQTQLAARRPRDDRYSRCTAFQLSREWQTGDHPFDGRIYILSDDPLVLETLSINGRMRAVLLRLLATAGRALHCQDGRLWIVCAAEGEAKETSDEDLRRRFAGKFGADLQQLRDSLTSVAGADLEASRDLANAPRAWAARLSASCVLAGLAGGGYSLYLDRQQVVHDVIVRWSNGIALGAAVALCAFVVIRLRGTSVAHRALMDILLAAVPGIWLAANGALAWYNEHLDDTRPATYAVRVEDVQRTQRKSKYVYHLEVENWPDPRGNRKVRIDESVSVFVRAGGCVDVSWRRGRLGDGWVAAYQQNNNGQCGGAFVE
jgi:hypothetical protein